MKKKTDPEAQAALDAWADKIAALEPDIAAEVARVATRLAADRRIPKVDRDFAQAQVDAVRRALRRAKGKPPATAKGTPKPRKKSRNIPLTGR
ncbi:MAG TPA: hypothetical protein VMV69_30965 [Pirellulales bacterium]|nr:hypothetical protein [Pirellulales bacterium]